VIIWFSPVTLSSRLPPSRKLGLVPFVTLALLVSGCGDEAVPEDRVVIRIYAREYEWCARGHDRTRSLDDCAHERLQKSLSASGLALPPHWPELLDIWREVAYLTQVQGWSQAMADAALKRRLEGRVD